jgi:hypothetical protein
MFLWTDRGSNKRRKAAAAKLPKLSKYLRVEGLENRNMLSGTVNVVLDTTTGSLTLHGDGSNNNIQITQTTIAGQYLISAPTGESGQGTLFQLNGNGQTASSETVDDVFGDIIYNTGSGTTTFTFVGTGAASGMSNVPADLTINNGNGSHTNMLQNIVVNGDLSIARVGGTSGYAELQIIGSTVIGDTDVTNGQSGANTGDTFTKIDTSTLEGGDSDDEAFYLTNGDGYNMTSIQGNSQFGTGPFGNSGQPVVSIVNGNGGSQTTFTGASQVAGPGTTTVYGAVSIDNGTAPQLDNNIVTFNLVNILGAVNVDNQDSNTITMVTQSTLGSQLVSGPTSSGGPTAIQNGAGYDSFTMNQSTMPWGLYINNDVGNDGDSTWGSGTQITASFIGTRIAIGSSTSNSSDASDLILNPLPDGVAFEILGDAGADVVNISSTTFGGQVTEMLFDGNNSSTITNLSTLPALTLVTGRGRDSALISNSTITEAVDIAMGDGGDSLELDNEDFATQFPSELLGSIEIDGQGGVNTLTENGDTGFLSNVVNFQL